MRFEIDVKQLASELWAHLRPEMAERYSLAWPTLLPRKDAARYLGVSVRLFDTFDIPRVVITERCIRFRREDLDLFAQERIRA